MTINYARVQVLSQVILLLWLLAPINLALAETGGVIHPLVVKLVLLYPVWPNWTVDSDNTLKTIDSGEDIHRFQGYVSDIHSPALSPMGYDNPLNCSFKEHRGIADFPDGSLGQP